MFWEASLIRCTIVALTFNWSCQDNTHTCYPAQPYQSHPQPHQNIPPFSVHKGCDVRRSQGIRCQSHLYLALSASPDSLHFTSQFNTALDKRRCPLDQTCPNHLPRPSRQRANLGISRTLRTPLHPSSRTLNPNRAPRPARRTLQLTASAS